MQKKIEFINSYNMYETKYCLRKKSILHGNPYTSYCNLKEPTGRTNWFSIT